MRAGAALAILMQRAVHAGVSKLSDLALRGCLSRLTSLTALDMSANTVLTDDTLREVCLSSLSHPRGLCISCDLAPHSRAPAVASLQQRALCSGGCHDAAPITQPRP